MPKFKNFLRKHFKKFDRRKSGRKFTERTGKEDRRETPFPAKKILVKTHSGIELTDYIDKSPQGRRHFFKDFIIKLPKKSYKKNKKQQF